MMMQLQNAFVVAEYTFGSFRQFVTDPVTIEEALEIVANPSAPWRPQDSFRIFELVEYE